MSWITNPFSQRWGAASTDHMNVIYYMDIYGRTWSPLITVVFGNCAFETNLLCTQQVWKCLSHLLETNGDHHKWSFKSSMAFGNWVVCWKSKQVSDVLIERRQKSTIKNFSYMLREKCSFLFPLASRALHKVWHDRTRVTLFTLGWAQQTCSQSSWHCLKIIHSVFLRDKISCPSKTAG